LVLPQATTVPSLRNARLCALPPATAMALVKSGGTLVCPDPFAPHAITELAARADWPAMKANKSIARTSGRTLSLRNTGIARVPERRAGVSPAPAGAADGRHVRARGRARRPGASGPQKARRSRGASVGK
jgi:hypothetical protein